ncbi:MAG: hypothetical protein WBM13_01955 [Bacteroidia bacterium]
MFYKLVFFTIAQLIPLYIWVHLLKKKQIQVDLRLVASYFIFGSWFGMFGELFLFKFIDWIFNAPIWEYRTLPIHDGITSSYGPIMWGLAAVYICLHKNYPFTPKKRSLVMSFILESSFLLVLELLFNFLAYFLFHEYFFYYFVPDLLHWSSFTNMPFWWVGYQIMVKYAKVMYKQEKLNLAIAVMMIIIAFAYQ